MPSLSRKTLSLPALFLLSRLVLLLSLPVEGLIGYGDFPHFHGWAGLEGWPYLDHWVEFPPVFPFLNEMLFRLAGGRAHTHAYLLALTMTVAQAASLAVFVRLAHRMFSGETARWRGWMYFALLLPLFYGWGYFDPLAVLALLLALWWFAEGRTGRAGLALGVGGAIKLFPLLALAAVWALMPPRRALRVTAAALGVVVGLYALLFAVSPAFTAASLRSQVSKGSWETVWALVDGNLQTGNFGAVEERLHPETAGLLRRNPPRVPSSWTLLPFALLGLALYFRARKVVFSPQALVAFTGLTFCVFWLWSPGWSPQWTLFLLPVMLLGLPWPLGGQAALTFLLVNLLEWPVLLSRGYFQGLWITISLRTLLLGLLAVIFWNSVNNSFSPVPQPLEHYDPT